MYGNIPEQGITIKVPNPPKAGRVRLPTSDEMLGRLAHPAAPSARCCILSAEERRNPKCTVNWIVGRPSVLRLQPLAR